MKVNVFFKILDNDLQLQTNHNPSLNSNNNVSKLSDKSDLYKIIDDNDDSPTIYSNELSTDNIIQNPNQQSVINKGRIIFFFDF